MSDASTVDLTEFETAAASGDPAELRRAVDMYRSDLLGNLDVRAPEFDEWVLTLRVRARDAAMRSGLDDLSKAAGEKPTDGAIAVARKLLADCRT